MTPRTEGGLDVGNPFTLLPVLSHGHLAFHLLKGDGRTSQVDAGLAPDAFRGIDHQRFIIFLELPPEKNARSFGDNQGRGILFNLFLDHLFRLFEIPGVDLPDALDPQDLGQFDEIDLMRLLSPDRIAGSRDVPANPSFPSSDYREG